MMMCEKNSELLSTEVWKQLFFSLMGSKRQLSQLCAYHCIVCSLSPASVSLTVLPSRLCSP